MKRSYVTPAFAVELFSATQSVPACITKIGALSDECVMKDADATDYMKRLAKVGYFAGEGCEIIIGEGMDIGDSICYHTSAQAAFTS